MQHLHRATRSEFRKDSWESANPDEQCDTRSILRQVGATTRLRRCGLRKTQEQYINEIMHRGIGRGIE